MAVRTEEILVLGFASLALVSSLGIMFAYFVCASWRRELKKIKKVMLLLSMCTFLASAADLDIGKNKSDLRCRLQGSMIQVFGVGAVLFQGILAIETAVSVSEVYSKSSATQRKQMNAYEIRLAMYVTTVFLFGAITCAISNANDYYQPLEVTDYLCYLRQESVQADLMSAGPVVVSVILMLLLNVYTWICVVGLLKNLLPASQAEIDAIYNNNLRGGHGGGGGGGSSIGGPTRSTTSGMGRGTGTGNGVGSAHGAGISCGQVIAEVRSYIAAAKRLDPIAHRTIFRLVCTPLLYLATLIIPSIVCQVAGYKEQLYTVMMCALISVGTINFVTWVLMDEQAMKELRATTCSSVMEALLMPGGDRDSSYGTQPRSEHSDEDDEEAIAAANALDNQLLRHSSLSSGLESITSPGRKHTAGSGAEASYVGGGGGGTPSALHGSGGTNGSGGSNGGSSHAFQPLLRNEH